jgi:Fe-S oxidoreductase
MLGALARGDFRAAATVYAKKVPFPDILSRCCDQPCRPVCRRREVGDAINIGLLERSCAELAGFVVKPTRSIPSRAGRVAVVGAGPSGLTAALELARKSYAVSLFEGSGQLGGRLRLLPAAVLPPKIIDAETGRVAEAGVDLFRGIHLGLDVTLTDLLGLFDAVYLSIGGTDLQPGAKGVDPSVREAVTGGIDPLTLATSRRGVFVGGSLCRAAEGGPAARDHSPVLSMSDGRKAATSIDRFLNEESLSSQRENEGPYQSRLYTNLEGIEPAYAVSPAGPGIGYAANEAVAEAARCLQCECLECVKACTYLEYFKEYPGKCIRKVTKNITSLPGKSYRTHTKFINACSLCGLCGAICPTDLNMAVVNSESRRIMCDSAFMPPAIHEFALQDMEASGDEFDAIVRHQPGHVSSAYAFFPGCQLAASAPGNVDRAYRHLAATLPGGVGFMLGCCGAPAAWSGRQGLFDDTCAAFAARWEGLGKPRVILACPTCLLLFQTSLPHVPVVSLWEVLDREGLPAGAARGRGETLAVHDSCTARAATAMQDSVRSLVAKLGYRVEELHYSRELTKCCGYGGLMYLVNPELTGKVIESRVEESPSDYLTYCANCRDLFASKGKASYHVLDLVFGEHRAGEVRPGPTFSERRANRRRLAVGMLAELWGETMPEPPEYTRLKARIPPEVAAKMERERILVEDVQRVIHEAERGGDKLVLPAAGRFIAHYRPSLVTYWVEYGIEGDEYVVCNAYSHRMQIVDDPAGHDS